MVKEKHLTVIALKSSTDSHKKGSKIGSNIPTKSILTYVAKFSLTLQMSELWIDSFDQGFNNHNTHSLFFDSALILDCLSQAVFTDSIHSTAAIEL